MAVNLGFLHWSRYFSFKQLLRYPHKAEWTPFQTRHFSENLVAPGIEPRRSGSVARTTTEAVKICVGPFGTKCVECWHPLLQHFNMTLFDHPHTGLILLQATTTYLPTRKTGYNHSASTVVRSWLKVLKSGWAQAWCTSLTQAYKMKCISQYEKRFKFGGGYVEKYLWIYDCMYVLLSHCLFC
jgi:hypothetical protein